MSTSVTATTDARSVDRHERGDDMDHEDRDLENASDADHDEATVKPDGR